MMKRPKRTIPKSVNVYTLAPGGGFKYRVEADGVLVAYADTYWGARRAARRIRRRGYVYPGQVL